LAGVPKLLGNDRLDLMIDPIAFGLVGDRLVLAHALGGVRNPHALGRRVPQEPGHRRHGERASAAGPVALLVEQAGDRLLAAVLLVQLVQELPDRGFRGVRDELPVLPDLAKG
jgi:hypothetical protein